jgi:hypothetical protein
MPLLRRSMRNLLLIIFIFCVSGAIAQELNCTVTINANQIATSDRGIFKDMKAGIEQFMNSRKWTGDNYKSYEKINCNLLITIMKMPQIGNFTATVQIRSSRPVYNTNYSSLIFNFADREWEFEYYESQPLEYNDNTFTANLTSMLAMYAYIMIGVDYDSFSELGGTNYFQKAFAVVNNAQQSGRIGWQSISSNRNRYWITENYNNPQMTEIRRATYSYHRLGLDTFDKTPDKSRETILKGLREVKKVRDINPSAILVISFFDAKSKELVNIFSSGDIKVRREVYDIITAIDPSNRSAYDKIIQN